MKVAIIGTGYVGLVSGTCFADLGWDVTCVDRAFDKIEKLKKGETPIYEPGLPELVESNIRAGRLHFTTDTAEAVRDAAIVLIAVGTPTRKLDGNADLQYVYAAAREIGQALDHFAVIVTKSTVPAGTGFQVRRIVSEANPGLDFEIASNPEFLREGNAIYDFMHPDRIVIGTESDRAREMLERLYQPFIDDGVEFVSTDVVSSELIKYAANTFLATKVSFINEMADICERVGGNIEDVSRGMGTDRRIGRAFLQPGPGYGGSCFPKDTLAMVHIGERALSPATIVEAVISVNRQRCHRMVAKVLEAAGGDVRGRHIAFLGLTFKPNTDDVRDSVALVIAEELAGMGAIVRAYDPEGMEQARSVIGDVIAYCSSADEALEGADICVIATEWKEFRDRRPEQYRRLMARPVMIDLRNMFPLREMAESGFRYVSIGRKTVEPEADGSHALAELTAR